MTVANVSANKISSISRQCHPAAIAQMEMASTQRHNAEEAWPKAALACICKHGDGITSLPGLKHRKGLGASNLARMLGLYHRCIRWSNLTLLET